MGGGLPALKGGDPPPAFILAAKVGPESSIRTLYVYWGLTLVHMDQILPRGVQGPLCVFFSSLFDLSELGPYFGHADLYP